MRVALLLGLLLAGCGDRAPVEAPANTVDPLIAETLAEPLMIDPALERQANRDALRPADAPFSAPLPPGTPEADSIVPLGQRVAAIARTGRDFRACALDVAYGMGWAARLSAELPLPSSARVIEAAGSDRAECRLRIVSYAVADAPDAALGHWRELARRSGFIVASDTDGTLIARRTRDGAVLNAKSTARPGGSAVDIVTNRGS